MGGQKPARELGGVSLFRRMSDWAGAQSDLVAISLRDARKSPDRNLPLLIDLEGNLGPIAALHSALAFAKDRGRCSVLLVGCDQPFLPVDLLARLNEELGDSPAVIPVCEGRPQSLAALWRSDPAHLEAFIRSGGRAIWRYADEIGAKRLRWDKSPGKDPFFDVNDMESLAEAERRMRDE
ncbi:molybdenum cofactor guanylyltransferase [Erythrobacter mangrovi]|uniref:Molybdenum cofactor guanylyltransferase n=2 Tax=Erythrobacter mangrovi TaxID=2739433 RepID=A0A7D3Y128_9SPHN|nr:molybdenum cofactor guanylyltransferase [Erythrobacter mangrovi]